MKRISIKSKRAQSWLRSYELAKYNKVTEAYANPSDKKIWADKNCQELCQQELGYRYRIISAGTQYFTAAWTTVDGNIRVETAYNSYIIEL